MHQVSSFNGVRRRVYSATVIVGLALLVGAPASAQPRQVGTFVFLIDHGLTLTSRTDTNGETVSVSAGKIRSVVSGRKMFDNQGTGRVTFWKRSVADGFFAGNTALDLVAHSASPPFFSDAVPGGMHALDAATLLGSFYGETNLGGKTTPVRAFSSSLAPALWLHLLVIPVGMTDYTVVACWDFVATTIPKNCAISGTGPALSNLAGAATYTPGATSTKLTLNRFLVP